MKKKSEEHYDVIVIGGGPSGMMAAGRAAELGKSVLLLEKNARLGEKLLITGGGRSNITNYELDDRKLLAKFKKRSDYLFSPFAQFSVKETLAFFKKQGMETKLEAEGRMFPKTEKAETVWKTMLLYLKHGGVTVRSHAEVRGFLHEGKRITGVRLHNGEIIAGTSYVLATGGMSHPETGSTGDGFAWLADIGHTVVLPSASLVPVRTKEEWGHKLAGISLSGVRLAVIGQKGRKVEEHDGKILFTHVGISGPLVLNMSRTIGEQLKYGRPTLHLDLFPKSDPGAVDRTLRQVLEKAQNKKIGNAIGNLVPGALFDAVLSELLIDPNTPVHSLKASERKRIAGMLKGLTLTPTGLLGKEKAIVTSGGLSLKEVDMKTMRSKKFENLHVVGDVLDIDRPSGGYSLQLCWTTGFVAGTHA